MLMNKKGQSKAGLITALVIGIAGLIVAVLISFVIITTLNGAGFFNDARSTTSVVNETITITDAGTNLAAYSNPRIYSCSVSAVNNGSNTINSGNYTLTNSGCTIANETSEFTSGWNITYDYTLKSNQELSSEKLSANFTKGVDNVSSKIPTVLLVAAIVLILGIMVLLVAAWKRMQIGNSNI